MSKARLLILGVVVVAVATACGGNDSGDADAVASIEDVVTTTTAVAGTADSELAADEDAVLAFATCMRDEGIDFPDPVVDSDGNVGFDLLAFRDLAEVDQTELEEAFEPCAPLLSGVNFGFDQIFETEFQDQLVAFSGCMRENGFDMPDPDFSALTTTGEVYPELDLDDPDFEVAFTACEETLPGIPGIAGD